MEFQQLGWNAVTIGFAGTIFFSVIGIWGTWQQNKAIWNNESGKSVSVSFFSGFTALLIASVIYGLSINSAALTFRGLRAIINIPVLIGLWKFKGFNRLEKLFVLFLICILTMMFHSSHKDWFFLFISFGCLLTAIMQPIEIWMNKSSGVVDIKLLLIFLAGAIFWTIYGYAIHDWTLQITCPLFLANMIVTLILWIKYKNTI